LKIELNITGAPISFAQNSSKFKVLQYYFFDKMIPKTQNKLVFIPCLKSNFDDQILLFQNFEIFEIKTT
jgi:hypothetical protein